ncbi:zinc ribbon domain-containing protein [bacterium]|nr:zinc ribbon domain-containing protein [bacterium]
MGSIECSACGRTISSDATSCKYCGEPVKATSVVDSTLSKTVVCPQCEHSIKAGLDVCPHCGFARKVSKKKAAPQVKRKSTQAKSPPQVIVPRKKTAKTAPASKKQAAPPPVAKSRISTREPRTRTPEPPTKSDQERIDTTRRAPATSEVPSPPGLDDSYLPERPDGLPASDIHVFLRGLQLAVKPMDYPTLITNIRSYKIKLNDFIYNEVQKNWRTIADLFNLPEIE